MRLFVDANVIFFAAHNPQGNTRALFRLATTGGIMLVASRYAIEEATRNISLKFPEFGLELESLLACLIVVPEPAATVVSVATNSGLPEKDVPILAAAIAARADLLVTGDRRHFGALYGQAVQGVLVLPPVDALRKTLDFLLADFP
ncbi:MAG: PIN domain-containing protein [Candidatus Competibacteraceae bacterium]